MESSNDRRARQTLAQMTLDEKLAQLGSCWFYDLQTGGALDWAKAADRLSHGIGQITRLAGASTLEPVSAARTANRLQKYLLENTRLGIPALIHEEACSGAMMLGGTVFPQMLGLASTFQPELAQAMTSVIRQQLLATGARQALAPVLDVARDPRWGRVEETFGEDPILVSHFGMAYIRGLQTEDLGEGVMATGKHFIGHSLSQGGLNCAPVHMGMRELYDTYLLPFQAAIQEAKLASVMNAYPELDGEVVGTSRRILTGLLREELGFDGLLVSDYETIQMIQNFHHVAADISSAATMALRAGIEIELPATVCYGEPLKAALDSGQISLELVDQAVERHLKKKLELGLFENPYVNEGRVLEIFETQEQRLLAREIARKSMVLLKNNGLLPLPKFIRTLAIIGPNAHDGRSQLGDYTYAAMSAHMQWSAPEDSSFYNLDPEDLAPHEVKVVTVLEGIRAAASGETEVLYARGCGHFDSETPGEDEASIAEAVGLAHQADAVVLVLGDRSGLTPDCTSGETRDSADLRLPGRQEELARAILAAGKPVAAVLITGRPYALTALAEGADALLQAWMPGEEGGSAVADILFGDANPGGKLPITFPRSVGQVPVFYNAKPSGTKSHWFGDYVDEKVAPLFPFGHGLSYTSFDYRDLRIEPQGAASGGIIDISLSIQNVGEAAGEEVVQLYIHDEVASIPRPVKELKGYSRIMLEPGETLRMTFHLPVDQLAFYDVDMNLSVEPGTIQVMVGSSSEDIRLRGKLQILGDGSRAIKERVFVCPVTVGR